VAISSRDKEEIASMSLSILGGANVALVSVQPGACLFFSSPQTPSGGSGVNSFPPDSLQ
jgi:hypothetical protein